MPTDYFSGIFIQDCEDWKFKKTENPKIQDFQAQKVHHELDVQTDKVVIF